MCPRWVARPHGPSSEPSPTTSHRIGRRDEPDQPTDLPKESWPAILKRTFKQFSEDQLTTWAAALTYFGVLSLFPMLLALVSVLGVIGPSATQPLLDNLGSVAPARPRTSSRTSSPASSPTRAARRSR